MSIATPGKHRRNLNANLLIIEHPWDRAYFNAAAACFVLLVIGWVYAVPGFVASRDDVLTSSAISRHLTGQAARQWEAYKHRRDELIENIRAVDARIEAATETASSLPALVAVRQQYSVELSSASPLRLIGMVGDWLNEIWAMSYLALGCLIAVWLFPILPVRWSRVWGWAGLIYVISFGTSYVRNHVLTTPDAGRTTYYWVAWDISKTSYLLQELRQLAMYLLISVFWEIANQKVQFIDSRIESISEGHEDVLDRAVGALGIFRDTLTLWQLSTLLILIVFVPRNIMYWNLAVKDNDLRYLPSVLIIDGLWLATWFFSMRPLLSAMKYWNEAKLNLIIRWNGNATSLDAILADASNSSDWQILVAGLAAVASLLLPLVKALM